ncbi:MAG: bifunctional serine/threonine-protein kinase/ABC transporter substrate-binding protein [Candidatus Eremiobacterota bacterium]
MRPQLLQNRYKILGVLGRGGMGVVYLCEDLRLPGKRWALKEMVIPDPALAAQARESFEQEAAMMSTLRHRHLPELIDYFADGDRQYLVMEYVEGPELLQLVQKEGPVTEVDALRWGLELSQVLDYLHNQPRPIIYRDLKPMNVIVSEGGKHVKLVDFGLARYFRPDKRRDTHASGSAGYAPPELWEDLHQTDARSDLYSLGATLYFALTGKHPSPVYGTNHIEQHRTDLSPGTVALINRCLEPDPRDRYDNVQGLQADLRGQLDALGARNTTTLRRRDSVTRRRRKSPAWMTVLMVLATLAVLAGALALVFPHLKARGSEPPMLHDPYERFLTLRELRERARGLYEQGQYARVVDWLAGPARTYPEEAALRILQENARVRLPGKPVLRLPAVTSLTGTVGRDGYQLLHGFFLAQRQYNLAHPERPLVLDVFDDGSQVDRLLELCQRLEANPDYVAALGPFDSQRTLAVGPFLNGKAFPMLAPLASDPRVGLAGPYVFSASDCHLRRIDAVADYFYEKGLREAALLGDEESRLSASVAQEFEARFTALGGRVVLNQTFTLADPDFARQIRAIRESRADCAFLADYRVTVVVSLARKMRAAGLRIPIACHVPPYNAALPELWKEDLDGLLMTTWFNPEAPEAKSFRQAFETEFDSPGQKHFAPGHREAFAYDALNLMLRILTSGDAPDRARVRDELARATWRGVTGTFRPGHQDTLRPVYLVELRGGRYRVLETR